MLPVLVFLALAAFAAALLGPSQAGRAATVHLMLAVGAMPLIFGAMSHFIPVLTRTRTPAAALLGIPVLALTGGVAAVGAFSFPDLMAGQFAGALLAAFAATALFVWSQRRRAGMLGRLHPGRQRQCRRQKRRQSQHVGADQDRTDDGSNDGAGQRKETHGFRQRRQVKRADERNRQPREKPQGHQRLGERPDFPRVFARWRRHVAHVALIPRIP